MWVKKEQSGTNKEKVDISKKKLFHLIKKPFWFGVFATGAVVSLYAFGSRFDNWQSIHSFSEIWALRYFFLAVFGITFIVTYILQILFPQKKLKSDNKFMLCTSCDEFYDKNMVSCPKCGGELVDSRLYRWKN